MTGRGYMGEALIQVWLKSREQSECVKNTSGVHASSCKPMKKVCDENDERNKKK